MNSVFARINPFTSRLEKDPKTIIEIRNTAIIDFQIFRKLYKKERCCCFTCPEIQSMNGIIRIPNRTLWRVRPRNVTWTYLSLLHFLNFKFSTIFYVFKDLVFLGGQPIFRLRKPVSATCCDLWLRRPVESRPPQRKQLSRCGSVWLGVNVTSSWENINSMQLSRSQDIKIGLLCDQWQKGWSPPPGLKIL